MKKHLLYGLLLAGCGARAQIAPGTHTLNWTHDGVNITKFTAYCGQASGVIHKIII